MKEALISSSEPRETGYRVAQVVDQYQTFEVGQSLFWVECADDVKADQFWYDPETNTIKILPSAIIVIDKDKTNPKVAIVFTSYPHNLETGNSVDMTDQMPIEYVGIYNIVKIDANNFSYIMENEPLTNAINVGKYDVLD